MSEIKLCIACSSGGHLNQALRMKEIWKNKNHFFITERRCNGLDLAKYEKTYFITPARRKIHRFFVSFLQAFRIIWIENPSAILSTGAEIGYPVMLAGFLLRKRIVYVETFARVDDLSLTGKLVYPFLSNFFIQWEPLKNKFPRAKYEGSLY